MSHWRIFKETTLVSCTWELLDWVAKKSRCVSCLSPKGMHKYSKDFWVGLYSDGTWVGNASCKINGYPWCCNQINYELRELPRVNETEEGWESLKYHVPGVDQSGVATEQALCWKRDSQGGAPHVDELRSRHVRLDDVGWKERLTESTSMHPVPSFLARVLAKIISSERWLFYITGCCHLLYRCLCGILTC